MKNYAYQDAYGKEAFAWEREFHFPNAIRHFDAVMWYDRRKKTIVDAFGTHQDFVSELQMSVREDGGLTIVSGRQWLELLGVTIPLVKWFKGEAVIHEWYSDEAEAFYVHVHVRNLLAGTLFEYKGSFKTDYVPKGGERH